MKTGRARPNSRIDAAKQDLQIVSNQIFDGAIDRVSQIFFRRLEVFHFF
jgi:hypothetical protein